MYRVEYALTGPSGTAWHPSDYIQGRFETRKEALEALWLKPNPRFEYRVAPVPEISMSVKTVYRVEYKLPSHGMWMASSDVKGEFETEAAAKEAMNSGKKSSVLAYRVAEIKVAVPVKSYEDYGKTFEWSPVFPGGPVAEFLPVREFVVKSVDPVRRVGRRFR